MAGQRGLVVPQNTFIENIIKTASGVHENFLLGGAQVADVPIVYCSNGFINLAGYKKNQVVKKKANCSFMYGSLTTKDAVRELRNALRDKISTQVEILLYKKDGTPFWVLLNIGAIRDELDTIVLFLMTFQDITEYKEPINPTYRKHRWTEFNRALHSKPVADNPISKARQEKNRIHIGQLMEARVDDLPEYKQDIPKTPWYIILHCSTPKVIWDWLILILILYTATSVPFIVCFKYDSTPMTVADSIVDFIFLIDIALNFHTSYMGEDSTIVLDVRRIRRKYFRGWFAIDLITSLPYGVLSLILSDMGKSITNLIGFLKAIRLLRLNRVVRALDQYLEYGFITLILWMLFFCLCAHWMACIFYAIADHYDHFDEIGWVRTMADATQQPLIYINGTVVQQPTLASLYMSSLYFSLTSLTSIGFGNIAPNTTAEKIFSCVTMIFGGLCYAVIFGQVTAIVQQSQKKSESYHQTLENMRSFCKLYKVPKEISTRIIDYYMYNWALSKGVDTNQVLEHCPKDLQSDICIHLNKKIIDTTPAFGELSNAVLRAIARNFAIHRVAPGERIVHEGESLDTVYFVASGSFEITRKGNLVGLVGEGDVFGDDVCRFNDVGKSVADVFALTYGDVHSIGRDELLGALSFYPEYGVQFSKVFRISYNLRDEAPLPKYSTLPQPKPCRRSSFVDEMNSSVDMGLTRLDIGTPNSQNMTDTDPPSKSFAFVRNSKSTLQQDGMTAISEGSEVNDSGLDDDLKHWNEFQTRKTNSEELFNEISGMKSEVRREIESMGGKMNHLEQNIAAILNLLKDRGTPTHREMSSMLPPWGGQGVTPGSANSNRTRTSTIIGRAKAEIPEATLPDWVDMENFGMGESGRNSDITVAVEKNSEDEKVEEKTKESEKVEGPEENEEVNKKGGLKNKRKKKGLKNKRKTKDNAVHPEGGDETEQQLDAVALPKMMKDPVVEVDGNPDMQADENSALVAENTQGLQQTAGVQDGSNQNKNEDNMNADEINNLAWDEDNKAPPRGKKPKKSRKSNADTSSALTIESATGSRRSIRAADDIPKSAEKRSRKPKEVEDSVAIDIAQDKVEENIPLAVQNTTGSRRSLREPGGIPNTALSDNDLAVKSSRKSLRSIKDDKNNSSENVRADKDGDRPSSQIHSSGPDLDVGSSHQSVRPVTSQGKEGSLSKSDDRPSSGKEANANDAASALSRNVNETNSEMFEIGAINKSFSPDDGTTEQQQ